MSDMLCELFVLGPILNLLSNKSCFHLGATGAGIIFAPQCHRYRFLQSRLFPKAEWSALRYAWGWRSPLTVAWHRRPGRGWSPIGRDSSCWVLYVSCWFNYPLSSKKCRLHTWLWARFDFIWWTCRSCALKMRQRQLYFLCWWWVDWWCAHGSWAPSHS